MILRYMSFWAVVLMLLGSAVYGVYYIKYSVTHLREDLREVQRQIHQEKESMHVLQAEWAYLNQPERLEVLVEKYLDLREVSLAQIEHLPKEGVKEMLAKAFSEPTMVVEKVRDESEHSSYVRPVSHTPIYPHSKPSQHMDLFQRALDVR